MDGTNRQYCTYNSESLTESERVENPKIRNVVLLNKLTRWEVLCENAKNDAEIELMKTQFPGKFHNR